MWKEQLDALPERQQQQQEQGNIATPSSDESKQNNRSDHDVAHDDHADDHNHVDNLIIMMTICRWRERSTSINNFHARISALGDEKIRSGSA